MAKTLAMIFGVIFLILGILGFVVDSPMFGIFEVDLLHNLVHIVLGIWLIVGSRGANPRAASSALKAVGIVYIILAILGFILVPESGELFGLVAMNGADHWLHVVLGVILLIAGMSGSKPSVMQRPTNPTMPDNPQM